MRLQSRDGSIFEVEPSAMRLSSLIQEVLECSDSPEEELVPLPAVSGAMLAKVIDFCRAHGGVALEALEKPLPSADLAVCGVSRHDCELLDIPAEGLFELLRVATYLNMESLTSLTLAKLASLMIVQQPEKDTARDKKLQRRGKGLSPKECQWSRTSAASLCARVRKHCGKPPCGWSVRLWDAEQSAYVNGKNQGGTPFYVHDETGWYTSVMPAETTWGDGARASRKTWSQLAVSKLMEERCLESDDSDFMRHELLARALCVLATSRQQWEDALSGSACVHLPQLFMQTVGPCFDPSFQEKVVDLPRPLQRQMELFLGSEMFELLSDARALVEYLGLDTLAAEIGTQLERALDAWQAELQKPETFRPRVALGHYKPRGSARWTEREHFVQSLGLHADGTFVHRFYDARVCWADRYYMASATLEVGTWSVHRGPARSEPTDRSCLSKLLEGSAILEGTRHRVGGFTWRLDDKAHERVEPVRRVIACSELREWAEGGRRVKDELVGLDGKVEPISYLPTFARALEEYHRWVFSEFAKRRAQRESTRARVETYIADLRRFFCDEAAERCLLAATSCGAEAPAC